MTTPEVQNVSIGQILNKKHNKGKQNHKFTSEKKLAELWDCHRTTVSRILDKKGIRPYYLGPKKRGLKRYALLDIEVFVDESKAPNTSQG
jgi:hypothetical protein